MNILMNGEQHRPSFDIGDLFKFKLGSEVYMVVACNKTYLIRYCQLTGAGTGVVHINTTPLSTLHRLKQTEPMIVVVA